MIQANKGKKVIVAISGGVDSAVAAALLKKQGYDVTGVFMKYWADLDSLDNKENKCCSAEARTDALKVCLKLGIPFLTWDLQKEFKKAVVDDFIKSYSLGLTPNPCINCNKDIKFGLFFQMAMKNGADFISSGHYAQIKKKKGYDAIYAAKDKLKDQSYFLYNLSQKQLAKIIFPIGNYTKSEVRKLAQQFKLPVAYKKESQEICFVNDNDLENFLNTRLKANPGLILDIQTKKKLGKHTGIYYYTIGQRLPLGGRGPYYVAAKDMKKNVIFATNNRNSKYLFDTELKVRELNWIKGQAPKLPMKVKTQIRYHAPYINAKINALNKNAIKVKLDKKQFGICPGQSAVFYLNKELIGGGVISQKNDDIIGL